MSALLWAALWGAAGALLGVAFALIDFGFDREGPQGAELVALCAIMFAVLGATAGALFALLVAVVERRRPIEQLSPWRAGLLGAVPAALSSLQAFDRPVAVAGCALLGGALAAGSVTLAQRATPPPVDVGSPPGAGNLTRRCS